MQSAIKAKLMELGCYVDDELPDYIMVMVANKRTKSQMETDLKLFLATHTKEFVTWLTQVLKKLKEVKLTNPELYACKTFNELKRKATLELTECVIKKEKKIKIEKSDTERKVKSLSDDIPVNATKLVGNRSVKIVDNAGEVTIDDTFDIPSISEVNLIDKITAEINSKKRKISLQKSDSEDEDFINIKADADGKRYRKYSRICL